MSFGLSGIIFVLVLVHFTIVIFVNVRASNYVLSQSWNFWSFKKQSIMVDEPSCTYSETGIIPELSYYFGVLRWYSIQYFHFKAKISFRCDEKP